MKRILMALAAASFLSSCADKAVEPAPEIHQACLPLQAFTSSEDAQLAIELAELQSLNLPMITKAVLDDEDMRQADRACLAK